MLAISNHDFADSIALAQFPISLTLNGIKQPKVKSYTKTVEQCSINILKEIFSGLREGDSIATIFFHFLDLLDSFGIPSANSTMRAFFPSTLQARAMIYDLVYLQLRGKFYHSIIGIQKNMVDKISTRRYF